MSKTGTGLATVRFVHALLAIILVLSLFPILWMCFISLKSPGESISGVNAILVRKPTFDNYRRLFELVPIGNNFFNSLFTTVLGTVSSLFFCALAGFAFAKYNFPGRYFLFYFIVLTMLLPSEMGSVPLFIIMRKFRLINSLWSLIVPRIATAVGIFFMRQYILDVPNDLIDASKIDGCSDFGIFIRIILPVIQPALASWATVTAIARWNDFFWPLLFLQKASKYTLMVSISLLPVSDGLSTPWPVILAGSTLVVLPIVLLYILLQKFQKADLVAGAIKG